MAPHLNILASKERNMKLIRFLVSHGANSGSRHCGCFSRKALHAMKPFQAMVFNEADGAWVSLPALPDCSCYPGIILGDMLFFSPSLKSYRSSQKIAWGLWGHLGGSQAEAAEVKTLRKEWNHFVYIVFDFVLKRLLNWRREVWLLSLFGLLLSP